MLHVRICPGGAPKGASLPEYTINHEHLIAFIEERIGDRRVIRLIRKWLKAGVMENGVVTTSDIGSPQGSVISPLLSNIYLYRVFDIWAHQWRQSPGRGCMIVVRYADDFVCGFEREADAKAFLADLKARMETYGLSLHPEKTRLIEFGRYAAERRASRGLGKPETFTFLGFTHICGERGAESLLLLARVGVTGCGTSFARSKSSFVAGSTSQSLSKGDGWDKSCEATSPITRCLETLALWKHSDETSVSNGCDY